MDPRTRAWRPTNGFGRRFSLGLLTALAITLVAFEWRSAAPRTIHFPSQLEPEPPVELPPVVVIIKESKPSPARKRTSSPIIVAGIPDPVPDPSPDPDPEPDKGDPGAMTDPGSMLSTDTADTGPATKRTFDMNPEVRPYFMDCLKRSPDRRDACTEQRIDEHLRRRFHVPDGLRREVRTTVTFEIDAKGRIGKVYCAPKVGPEIEREVERVVRALPEFVPGSQGGFPVGVYYQFRLNVRTL